MVPCSSREASIEMRVLVTGATGYIGSHTVLLLMENGHEVIAVDNFSNSDSQSLDRLHGLSPRPFVFRELDVRDEARLTELLEDYPCDAVIHFAGFKSVGESIRKPLEYYENNIVSTLTLLKISHENSHLLKPKIIFSSSANIYGNSEHQPISEEHPTGVGLTNPYGKSKYFCEEVLRDACASQASLQVVCLRYFNPIGAHPSGMLGEVPDEIPNNLAPNITKVALGDSPEISVFGADYSTRDGTGIRDFIHVMDLAAGHIAAVNFTKPGFHAFNLGTGIGTSVFELIAAFQIATSRKLPVKVQNRRPGDLAISIADPTKANAELNWTARLTIQDACESAWKWESFRASRDG
jgi:UDP-glucose 4-epimerase